MHTVVYGKPVAIEFGLTSDKKRQKRTKAPASIVIIRKTKENLFVRYSFKEVLLRYAFLKRYYQLVGALPIQRKEGKDTKG